MQIYKKTQILYIIIPKYCNIVTNRDIGIIKLNSHLMVLKAGGNAVLNISKILLNCLPI